MSVLLAASALSSCTSYEIDMPTNPEPPVVGREVSENVIYQANPAIIMLAETSKPEFYQYGFDMIYDWNSSIAISTAFNGGQPADVVKEAREALSIVPEGKSILRYAFNHDVAAENNFDTYFGSVDAIQVSGGRTKPLYHCRPPR